MFLHYRYVSLVFLAHIVEQQLSASNEVFQLVSRYNILSLITVNMATCLLSMYISDFSFLFSSYISLFMLVWVMLRKSSK